MLKKAPVNRMLKVLLASWNQYDKSYKMYLRSREYKRIRADWNDDQVVVADFVLRVIKDKPKPQKVKCKKAPSDADIQYMKEEA